MTIKVTLVDYGVGNVFSVKRALETVGAEVLLTNKPCDIENSDRLVLPGVGAFAHCMSNLRDHGLIEPLLKFGQSNRPLLGICVGMQMLASVSEEFGLHEGLNLIPGRVAALPSFDKNGALLKIPHVGWAKLQKTQGASWTDSPLGDTLEREYVYMVHSFAFEPENTNHRLAECFYGEHAICAAVQHQKIFGTQFHPEKSGPTGLSILSRFLKC